ELEGPVEPCAELLGDTDRADVLLLDEVHDVVGAERPVHPVGGGARRLGRVAASPARAVDGPADLEVRPPFWLPRADAADELAARLLLDGPERVAAQVPVADEETDRPPGLGSVRRPPVTAEVAHRLLVGREARVGCEVLGPPRPEDQPFGPERRPVEGHTPSLRSGRWYGTPEAGTGGCRALSLLRQPSPHAPTPGSVRPPPEEGRHLVVLRRPPAPPLPPPTP